VKILLVGNFGVSNLGDELIAAYYKARFPEHEWTILSANPSAANEVPRLPFGVRSLFSPWYKTWNAFRKTDAVLFGGGSLLTDTESVLACLLWSKYAFLGRFFRKPVLFAFQGIGPFRTPVAKFVTRKTLNHATFLSVRDHESFLRASEIYNGTIIEAADPVSLICSEMPKPEKGSAFLIIPRANSSQEFFAAVQSSLHQSSVRIGSFQPDNPKEQETIERLKLLCGENALVYDIRTLDDLTGAFRGVGQLLTQRYHAALASVIFDIPCRSIAQREGDKLSALGSQVLDILTKARKGEEALKNVLGQ
jgi:polysaccharide pyruvyl transferase WcaK-like protein